MLIDFNALAQQCAPQVHPSTMAALVRVESGFNPYAIGVVGGRLARQPMNAAEARATVIALEKAGWNYSMGLAQVNRANLTRYGLTTERVFDPCTNLRAGAAILSECYGRAKASVPAAGGALAAALSCYYSGNFSRGQRADVGGTSYVQRVAASGRVLQAQANTVPAIDVIAQGGGGAPVRATAGLTPEPVASGARASSAGKSEAPVQGQRKSSWDAFGAFR